mgnify:CR=1 FL=1
MLQSISWQNYFTAAFIFMAIYYTIIWSLFFRNKLKFEGDSPKFSQDNSERTAFRGSDHKDFLSKENLENRAYPHPETTVSPVARLFLDELEALTAALGENCEKITVTLSLQKGIRKQAGADRLEDQATIKYAIKQKCEQNCSLVFSDEDVEGLWNG